MKTVEEQPGARHPQPATASRVHSEMIEKLWPDDMEMFWEDIARELPLVSRTADGDVLVTFCWRDAEADAVLLLAEGLTEESHLRGTLLERKPGTDLWHATYRTGPQWRGSYLFVVQRPGHAAPWVSEGHVDLRAAAHHGRPDPHNALGCRDRDGVLRSVAEGPEAPPQPWLEERDGIERGAVMWHAAPGDRGSWFYEPPGVGLDRELPLVVVLDGEVWTGPQSLPTTLDNLLADGEIPTVRAVFLDSAAAGGVEEETAYVADRLVPWVREARAVAPGAGAVTVVGQGVAGLTALRLGLGRPDTVGGVVAHSAALTEDPLVDVGAVTSLRLHLAHGSREWALAPLHRALAERLAAVGVPTDVEVHDGGHDYAWWRGAVADGLRAVLR